MKLLCYLLITTVTCLLTTLPSNAIYIRNTGEDTHASGSNFIDNNFTLVSEPAGYGYTSNVYLTNDKSGGFPLTGAYATAPANSAYVSPAGGSNVFFAPGNYVYQEAFVSDFTGTVTITGSYAADNSSAVSLVGATLTASSGLTENGFTTLSPFSLSFSAVNGSTYDLDFTVTNLMDGSGPGGGAESALVVANLTAVPEPTTWTAFGCVFLVGLSFMRRLRMQAVRDLWAFGLSARLESGQSR